MKLIALLSGGIDSPVAVYEMLSKGAEVILVHFHMQNQTSQQVEKKIIALAKILGKYGSKKLYLVPFASLQKEIIKTIPAQYRMIVYRRYMFKLAEIILEKEKADAFLTGDAVGQVASQTLDNLNVVWAATKKPVIAPLIGDNKEETIAIARKIKTYDVSIQPYNDCCSFMVAKHPETHSNLAEIELMEKSMKNLKLESIISKAKIIAI